LINQQREDLKVKDEEIELLNSQLIENRKKAMELLIDKEKELDKIK